MKQEHPQQGGRAGGRAYYRSRSPAVVMVLHKSRAKRRCLSKVARIRTDNRGGVQPSLAQRLGWRARSLARLVDREGGIGQIRGALQLPWAAGGAGQVGGASGGCVFACAERETGV